jgi:prepilin signal peptidase PulO-like enzyme (type II secretory pathway)
MDLGLVLAPPVAGGLGWLAAGWQHLLYRQAAYRVRAEERPLLIRRVLLAGVAAAVTAVAFRPDHYAAGPALIVAGVSLAMLVLASTDIERKLLPDRLMYPSILAAIAVSWVWPDRSLAAIWIGGGVAVAAGVGVFLLGQAVGSVLGARETPFGLGDVKLIVFLGFLLGWPAVLWALLFGVVAAGIPGLALTLTGRARSTFSYGPFLVLGGLVVLLFPGSFV